MCELKRSEAERIAAMSYSATPGGIITPGNPSQIDIEVGAFQDIATNDNVETVSLVLTEIADTVRPSLVSALIP